MRNKSHVLVTLLSRECLYSGNWRSILSVRYYQGRIERRGHATAIPGVETCKFLLLLKIAVSGINYFGVYGM